MTLQKSTHTYSTEQQAKQATLTAKRSAGPSINFCMSVFDWEFLDQREKDGYVLDSAKAIKPPFTKRCRAFICKKEIALHKAVHFMLQKTLMCYATRAGKYREYICNIFSGNMTI